MPSSKNVVIDRNGKVVFASCFFCDLVHVDIDKAGGKSFFDFIFPEDAEAVKARLSANQRPHVTPFLLKLKSSDGTPVWTEFQIAPIRTESGWVYAMTATVTLASESANEQMDEMRQRSDAVHLPQAE